MERERELTEDDRELKCSLRHLDYIPFLFLSFSFLILLSKEHVLFYYPA